MSFQQREYPKSTFDNWDFRNHHVGFDQGGANTNAITPENFFIAAGPARLQQVGEDFSNKVFPLGMTEQASVNQQKEIGRASCRERGEMKGGGECIGETE